MPPLPSELPGYQFWTVEYLISASSCAISSTTAACSWFSSRRGAVHPSRYETNAPLSAMISVRSNCPVFLGGLNRSTQHFILKGKDGVYRWIRDFVEGLQRPRRRSYGIGGSAASR